MKNEIEIINPKEFGIEEKKANELIGNLPQIVSERSVLEKQFDEIIKLDIDDEETTKKARELRLLVQKNRTQGINVWHRTTKDFFLKGGQFVDAIKRKEVAVNERMENALNEIEKHAEIKEQKRLEKLQAERVKKLSEFVENAEIMDLSSMADDVWLAYYESKKKEHFERIEAEKKAEEERKEKERIEKLYFERRNKISHLQIYSDNIIDFNMCEFGNLTESEFNKIESDLLKAKTKNDKEREEQREENERLKKEAEERERKIKEEEEKRKAQEEAARKEREEKERKEREAHEAELRKEREAREKIEREEREKREKLEAELRAKEEAERKQKEEQEAKLQAELSKGDSAKVKDLISDLEALKTKYEFKSKNNKLMYSQVGQLLDKVILHINK